MTKNALFVPVRDESCTYREEKPTKSGLQRPSCSPNGWLGGQNQLVLTSFPLNSHRVSTHGGTSERNPYRKDAAQMVQKIWVKVSPSGKARRGRLFKTPDYFSGCA